MLSNKLKSARLAKELTQSEVAKKLYVTRQTVSRWEQGKTLPNIYVIQELSDLYGISLDELVVNTALENKEAKSMKNVNPFALFGAILFNVFLFSLIVIFFGGFLLLSLFIYYFECPLNLTFSTCFFVKKCTFSYKSNKTA